jgi:hypothetical protein
MLQRRASLVPVHGYANALQAWQGMDPEQAFPQGQARTRSLLLVPFPHCQH